MTATTTAAKRPLLTLTTAEPDRPYITIDGEPYDLAVMDDFGLLEQARLSRLMVDARAIQAEVLADATERPFEAVSEVQASRATALLTEIVEMIVRAPVDVLAKLDDRRRVAIIAAFSPTLPTSGTAKPAPNRSTSDRSRRTSPRSTASARG